jgi:alkanesulfonate monooxygenase SsuD/methylene tetrahydromethanopterin reductase-like flavin-dependent oxidoreductase (luciferase family)
MARLAGEVADGFLVHPFHSPQYLVEVILPAIEAGTINTGRKRQEISISVTAIIISDHEEREFARQQIAFYASTPSYRPVMALHGWKEQAKNLSTLAARGKWAEMPEIISDDMLAVFTTVASSNDLAATLKERYHDIADRLTLYKPFIPGERDSFWKGLINAWS